MAKKESESKIQLQTVNPANYTAKELKVIGTMSALVIAAFLYLAYRGKFSTFGFIGMFVAGGIVGSGIGRGATLLVPDKKQDDEDAT